MTSKPNEHATSKPNEQPQFWRVEPNPLCVTCYDENNVATGLIAEKGGEYIVCDDCGRETCYGCLFSSQPPKRGGAIWCAKLAISKSPFDVCAMYERR